MRKFLVVSILLLVALAALVAGCVSAAPAAPTAVPTKAAAPAATIAPKAAAWPEKGKTITIVLPASGGGINDVSSRLLAAGLEKELGSPVQILNKPGATGMVGLTEVANSKPDGYILAYTIFVPAITNYLDADKRATYSRKSFQPIGNHHIFPVVMSVQKESPYKTVKELVDADKAKPGQLKAATSGIMSTPHLGSLQVQKETGVKFAAVQFDGGAPCLTALLGGHVDVSFNPAGEVVSHVKNDKVRVLAILDKEEQKLLPGAPTMESQGYKVSMAGASGLSAPAGTPKEVMDVLATAMKKVVSQPEHQQKLEELGITPNYLGPEDYDKFWGEVEQKLPALLEMAKAEAAAKP